MLLPKPIIIIGCNRSGTTLLFNNLSEHPRTWSLYIESQQIFYRHFPISPTLGDAVSSATPEQATTIQRDFYRDAHNKEFFKDGLLDAIPKKILQRPLNRLYKRGPLRLVEKTPANCFRIPLLKQIFPDAKFLFLIRRPEDTISSLMEGWKIWSQTQDQWTFGNWHYLVPPGWQDYRSRTLQEICAFQWVSSNETAWKDLNAHCPGQFLALRHEDLVANPHHHYSRILDFCELPASKHFTSLIDSLEKRVFTTRGSKPKAEKWKSLHLQEIMSVEPVFAPLAARFYGSDGTELPTATAPA